MQPQTKRFFLFKVNGENKILTSKGQFKNASKTELSRIVKLKKKIITFVPEWYILRGEHLPERTGIELHKHLNTIC